MAYESSQQRLTFVAGADLSAKQYYAVKLDSTEGQVVVCAATTDIPIGILQNAPASGSEAIVAFAGVTKVNGDSALVVGNQIGTAADGQLAVYVAGTDTTKRIIGSVIAATGVAGEYGTAIVNCPAARGA
jgi:hypothetical protein